MSNAKRDRVSTVLPISPTTDDPQGLRRCVRDLVALSTLPAIWGNADAPSVVRSLSEVVLRLLSVEFVYVRLDRRFGGLIEEVLRTRAGIQPAERARQIGQILAPHLGLVGGLDELPLVRSPYAEGPVRLAVFPLGHAHDYGLVVAASQRSDFPTDSERLLLGVAVNQAAGLLQRKEAEDDLRRSEEELSDFFENASVGMHWVGPDGTILRVNQAELKLLGYSRDEYLGRPIADFHVDPGVIADILKRLRDGETLRDYEARMRCKDGSVKDVLVDSSVLWAKGQFIHTRCFTRDITDRKRIEAALRDRELRYELVLAGSAAAIWDWDVSAGRVVYSPLWKQIRGYHDHEVSDALEEWSGGIHPEDRARVMTAVQAHLEGQTPVFAEEYRIRHKSGRWIWIVDRGLALRDSQGHVVRMAGSETDITERKRTEEALRESEQRFRTMADAAPAMLWITAADGSCTFLSRGWYEFTGQTQDQALGFGWLDAVHPDDREAARHTFLEANARQEPFSLDYRLRRADGHYRWTIDAGRARFAPDGAFLGYIGSVIDVHERKQAETKLRESEEQLRGIFSQTIAGIAQTDLTGRFVDVNERYCEILGRPAAELYGLRIQDIIAREGQVRNGDLFLTLAQGIGEPFVIEKRYVRPDGSPVWVNSSVSLIRDRSGEPKCVVAVSLDITDRKRVEEALAKQNDRLKLLSEAAHVLLSTDEPDAMLQRLFGKISVSLNLDAYFNFMVTEAGDALRLASYAGIPDEVARSISQLGFGQAVCGTAALHRTPIIASNIQNSGDPMVQLVKGFGIRTYACSPLVAGGRLLGTLSFASRSRDRFDADEIEFLQTITHYVTTAYERLRLIEKLREHDRRKDEFLATLAHELRNPLAPIRNAVQILKVKGSAAGAALEWIRDVVDRQVTHMARLLDDLLDIGRITHSKLELRKDRVRLADVLARAVETSQPHIDQAGHELALSLPDEPIHLDADTVRLAQVFANLLNNAAKYTPKGGFIRVTAVLSGEPGELTREVIISVRDTGIGISREMLPRVFEMFSQARPALERSHGGLGIGLALSKGIVEMHGGAITARSEGEGHGSEFIVRLPITLSPETPSSSKARDGFPRSAPQCRILVADDNDDSAQSLGLLLRTLGFEVCTARDGNEAVRLTIEFKPKLALLDIGMPDLNGYEVARALREQPWSNGLKLVAVSGWGQQKDKEKALEAGFDAHVTKPVDIEELQSILNHLLAETV